MSPIPRQGWGFFNGENSMVTLVLFVIALLLFLASAFGVASKINLQSMGLAFIALALILGNSLIAA